MALAAVNAVNNVGYVPPAANNNSSGVNPYATYEQILALQELNQLTVDGQTSTSSANDNILLTSDLLDLSPAALNVLNGISSGSGISTGASVNETNGTTLTPAQQQAVASVVAEYANQPLTAETFSQIETALTAAGIDPSQLSIQQLLEGYNYAYTPGYAFNEQLLTETTAES